MTWEMAWLVILTLLIFPFRRDDSELEELKEKIEELESRIDDLEDTSFECEADE